MTIRHLHMGCGESLLSPLFKTMIKPIEKKAIKPTEKQKTGKQKDNK